MTNRFHSAFLSPKSPGILKPGALFLTFLIILLIGTCSPAPCQKYEVTRPLSIGELDSIARFAPPVSPKQARKRQVFDEARQIVKDINRILTVEWRNASKKYYNCFDYELDWHQRPFDIARRRYEEVGIRVRYVIVNDSINNPDGKRVFGFRKL